MKKVVVFSTLVAVCLTVAPVFASGQGRADGCRTFNLWGHEPATDETDYLTCGYAEPEQARKVKHSDSTSTPEPVIVATESPVATPVVIFTPEPPIVCENEDDDDDNDGDECEGDATDDDETHEP